MRKGGKSLVRQLSSVLPYDLHFTSMGKRGLSGWWEEGRKREWGIWTRTMPLSTAMRLVNTLGIVGSIREGKSFDAGPAYDVGPVGWVNCWDREKNLWRQEDRDVNESYHLCQKANEASGRFLYKESPEGQKGGGKRNQRVWGNGHG